MRSIKEKLRILVVIAGVLIMITAMPASVFAEEAILETEDTVQGDEHEMGGELREIEMVLSDEAEILEKLGISEYTAAQPDAAPNAASPNNTTMAKAETINVFDFKNVYLTSANMTLFYAFTPTTTGFYTFMSYGNGECVPFIEIWNSADRPIGYEDDNAADHNFKYTYLLDAGYKYYIEVGCYESSNGSYVLTLFKNPDLEDFSPEAYPTKLSPEVPIHYERERKYYLFTPSKTATYTVSSTLKPPDLSMIGIIPDPRVWIYDSSGKLIASDDNSGDGDNFRLEHRFVAGEKYFIAAGSSDAKPAGIYYLHVKMTGADNGPAAPTNLRIDSYTEHTVYLMWDTPANHGADRWIIQYREKVDDWVNAAVSTTTAHTIGKLSPMKEYEFKVYSEAGSTAWSGTWSAASNIVKLKTPPPKAKSLKASNITEDAGTDG